VIIVEAIDKTGVVVKLEQRASLAGRVVDARGAAVAGARVAASPVRDKESMTANVTMDGMRDDSSSPAAMGRSRSSGSTREGRRPRARRRRSAALGDARASRQPPRRDRVRARDGRSAHRDHPDRGDPRWRDPRQRRRRRSQTAADVWITATLADDAPKTRAS